MYRGVTKKENKKAVLKHMKNVIRQMQIKVIIKLYVCL